MASLVTASTLFVHNLNKSYLPKQIFHPNLLISPSSSQSKLFLRHSKPQFNLNLNLNLRPSASSTAHTLLPTPNPPNPNNPFPPTLISDSTRSIASIFAAGLSISKLLAQAIHGVSLKFKGLCTPPSPEELVALHRLQQNLVCSMGPLFFAAVMTPRGSLSTPLTVVASGMAKWLDIYSGVLLVRVLLSWFPNIPWDRQPLSAIRDLCDPYLNLFRNIIPPLFDTLDVSPLLAFAVLGTFSVILNQSRNGML